MEKEINYMPLYASNVKVDRKSISKEEMRKRRKRGKINIGLCILGLTAALGVGGKMGMDFQKMQDEQAKIREEETIAKEENMILANAFSRFREDAINIVHDNMHFGGVNNDKKYPQWYEGDAAKDMAAVIERKGLTESDITELIFTIREQFHNVYPNLASYESTSKMVKEYCGMSLDDYMKAHGLPEEREDADNYLRQIIAIKNGYDFSSLESGMRHGM